MTIQRITAVLTALVWITGCVSTPMISTNEELQNLSENEGVVFGSVYLTVEPVPDNESGWAFLKGFKADKKGWEISIKEAESNLFGTTYAVPAKAGEEEIFVKKLPAGTYNILKVYQPGLFGGCCDDGQVYVEMDARFTVKPQQVSYIGKLTIKLPYRVTGGSRVYTGILDAQDETIEKLRGEFPSVMTNTVRDLAI